jgi:hypothetical protein
MKINDIFEEGGVGVVANNAKQARDPRYSMSMTADVKPGATAKQAAKFGNKLSKDGTPPKLRENVLKEKALAKKDLIGSEARGDVERKLKRLMAFVDKIKNGDDFVTTSGDMVKISPDPELLQSISQGIVPALLPKLDGGSIKLSELEKTSEFGGEGTGARMSAEAGAIDSLSSQLESIKGDNPFIMLNVGDITVKAAEVKKTPGTPKSDFEILDDNGKTVAWISHKDGSPADPKKFGQWAGLSSFANDPEVKKFVDIVKNKFPDGFPKGATALARTISNPELRMKAVYGKDFGGAPGINNVTTVLQGPVTVVQDGDEYKLTALAEFANGEVLPEGYTPIFLARFISDRGDFGIPHTRLTMYPLFGRKIDFSTDTDEFDPAQVAPAADQVFRRVTRPDWYKDYKKNPVAKSQEPRQKRD